MDQYGPVWTSFMVLKFGCLEPSLSHSSTRSPRRALPSDQQKAMRPTYSGENSSCQVLQSCGRRWHDMNLKGLDGPQGLASTLKIHDLHSYALSRAQHSSFRMGVTRCNFGLLSSECFGQVKPRESIKVVHSYDT